MHWNKPDDDQFADDLFQRFLLTNLIRIWIEVH